MENDIKKIIERLESLEKRVHGIEESNCGKESSENSTRQKKKLSLKEFLLSKNLGDDVKKALAVGYYLEKYDDFTCFNIRDLELAFERAKEKKPANMNDKVNMNIKNGYMDKASEKKNNRSAWYLTNTGEIFVQGDFKSNRKS